MGMAKIKMGDKVELLAGKDKGKQGNVIGKNEKKIKVQGLNLVHKCVRANPQAGTEGGIQKQEAWVDISNAGLVNPTSGKRVKVGIKSLDDGKKVRFDKITGDVIDQ